MEENQVITVSEARRRLLYKKACRKFVSNIKANGIDDIVFRIDFKGFDMSIPRLGCIFSLFIVGQDVFLHRYWTDDKATVVNRISNYDELCIDNPEGVEIMKQNAIMIYLNKYL